MTTEKEDTDPSTPSSRRPNGARKAYGLREAGAREPLPEDPNQPTTDPGLGPGPSRAPTPQPSPVSSRSRGVVVPAPSSLGPNAVTPAAGTRAVPVGPASSVLSSVFARAKDSKDSVELLLDGMAGPRPERRKTTPQSDGEASASYHARHGVHAAHASQQPGPKVVVGPAPSPEADTVPTPPPKASNVADTTFVPGRALARRIALALLAGLLMVLASFVVMDLVAPRPHPGARAASTPWPAEPSVVEALPTASAAGLAPATAPEPAPVVSTTSAAPAPVPSEVEVAKPAVSAEAAGTKRRRRGPETNDDLGEFKTSF